MHKEMLKTDAARTIDYTMRQPAGSSMMRDKLHKILQEQYGGDHLGFMADVCDELRTNFNNKMRHASYMNTTYEQVLEGVIRKHLHIC